MAPPGAEEEVALVRTAKTEVGESVELPRDRIAFEIARLIDSDSFPTHVVPADQITVDLDLRVSPTRHAAYTRTSTSADRGISHTSPSPFTSTRTRSKLQVLVGGARMQPMQ